MRFIKGRTLSQAVDAYHAKRRAGQANRVDLAALINAFHAVCNALVGRTPMLPGQIMGTRYKSELMIP